MSDPTPNAQPPTPIQATGLRKAFGHTPAVEEVSLSIPKGEIFGLVGPDGAGKTTVFRLLLGLLQPDAGEARLGGFDPTRQPQEARSLVGYVAQQFTLYGDLSVSENLEFVSDVRGLSRREYRERSRFLLDLTALAPFTRRAARDLSGGMKRKLALACALLHRPEILLLDEPTTGVDPVSRREFWRMLYGLPAEGVTLLVSTPYLDEAARCGRLGFMAGGRLLAVDTPEGLRGRMPDVLIEIDTPERTRARHLLQERPEVRRVETMGGKLRVAYDRAADGEGLARWLTEQGVPVNGSALVEATLEDVFSALSDRTGPPA
jgi:ABC-2 type transport system ATP-binding protein